MDPISNELVSHAAPDADRSRFSTLRSLFSPERIPLALSVSAQLVQSESVVFAERYSLYTPELNLMAETALDTASNPPIAYEYAWFGGQPLAQIETATGAVHYYFNDHLGTPLLTTDATGAVDWQVEREPYGKQYVLRTGASRHQPLAFPGQEEDASTDRDYNIFRWYKSSWSRYTQADPIGLAGGLNLYAYGAANPTRYLDPTGERVQLWCHQVGAGGGSGVHALAGAVTGAQHCFVRITCSSCPKYDLKLEILGAQGISGHAAFSNAPPTFSYSGNPASIVPITPSDNNDTDCKNEECLRRHYENYKRVGYPYGGYLSGPNSNTFANDLLNGCGFAVSQRPSGTTPYNSPYSNLPGAAHW
jgi:RHS repeat-associated protein